MPEKDIKQATIIKGAELAEKYGEDFILAVTAAYMAGIEAGKLAAQKAA